MSGKNVTEVVLADAEGIARAAAILESGGLVAVPTETVYGLAARADCADAVAKIYAAKGRPDFNPLIVHVSGMEQAKSVATFSRDAALLAEACWPGPLTLVLPARSDALLVKALTAGLPTVAVRVPNHPVLQALLEEVDFPLAAPSANRSGFISPTSAAHVLASLDGKIDLVLDAGPTEAGVESTIVGFGVDGRWEELRPGPIDLTAWHKLWFDDVGPVGRTSGGDGEAITAPGQLASHYAPGKPVRLNASKPAADEFMIGFGSIKGDCNLSDAGDLKEAAMRLYDSLHQAAAARKSRIAIASIPDEGIGRAMNDRLRRAAAPVD
ncbi:MAG: L-threonylcarbamoyladenylate synthase [Pseudomonadota bacterium]